MGTRVTFSNDGWANACSLIYPRSISKCFYMWTSLRESCDNLRDPGKTTDPRIWLVAQPHFANWLLEWTHMHLPMVWNILHPSLWSQKVSGYICLLEKRNESERARGWAVVGSCIDKWKLAWFAKQHEQQSPIKSSLLKPFFGLPALGPPLFHPFPSWNTCDFFQRWLGQCL